MRGLILASGEINAVTCNNTVRRSQASLRLDVQTFFERKTTALFEVPRFLCACPCVIADRGCFPGASNLFSRS